MAYQARMAPRYYPTMSGLFHKAAEQRLNANLRRLKTKLEVIGVAAEKELVHAKFLLLRESYLVIRELIEIKALQLDLLQQERKHERNLLKTKRQSRRLAAKREERAERAERRAKGEEPKKGLGYSNDWGFADPDDNSE